MARHYGSSSSSGGVSGGREGIALLWREGRFRLLGHKEVVFRDMLPQTVTPGEGGFGDPTHR
jgi:hypothetical protein